MKYSARLISIGFSLLVFSACAQEPVAPVYQAEAKLPQGWPEPGPYDQVSEKNYPAYRAAVAKGSSSNSSFFKLFRHIQKNDIPMTTPVEMTMDGQEGKMEQIDMGFLYQNQDVGKLGADGKMVEVKDISALRVLSYAWQGPRNKANLKKARAALEAQLQASGKTALRYRLFGYNGPGVRSAKKTFELQAVLK